MPLENVRIDDRTWSAASEARRGEWRSAIGGLLSPTGRGLREEARALRIALSEQALELELTGGPNDAVLAKVTLPRDALAETITEYVDIVRQIPKADGLARLEALDMAKKVTHDRGGRILRRLCTGFAMDHATARRLFTLLLTLWVDTTRLTGMHGHRRVR